MGCFICDAVAKGIGEESLVLQVTQHSAVMLNRFPYVSGHLMVMPKSHVSSLHDLSAAEMVDLHETLRRAVLVVEETLHAEGINVGMNLGKAAGAGLEEHIHYHVVPRFIGDSNAINVLADVRVIPESLEETWRRYAARFKKLR